MVGIDASTASVAAATQSDAFADGTFTDVSFFVLTGQVSAGDVIAAEELPEFMRQLQKCSSQDCQCDVALSSGQRKVLHFSYTVGQRIRTPSLTSLLPAFFPPISATELSIHKRPGCRASAHTTTSSCYSGLFKDTPSFWCSRAAA